MSCFESDVALPMRSVGVFLLYSRDSDGDRSMAIEMMQAQEVIPKE